MSTQNTRSSGRRSGRGPRRPRQRENEREEPRQAAPKAPEKTSLWQKIASFFAPRKKQSNGSSKPHPRSAPATTTSNYPSPSGSASRYGRKPEAIEVTSPKVYVGNLSFDATESDIMELFKGVGGVSLAEIVTHNHTQKSKGFGFVTMLSTEEAKRAVDVLHDKEFMGRKLVVSGAKTPADRR